MPDPIRIQFVCLGNICRSPLAKAAFRDKVESAGLEEHFEIASSGTGSWHIGDTADDRMRATAQRNGLSLEDHRASQFEAEDLEQFDHIFVMDKSNLNDVLHLDENDEHGGKVRLFREFDPEPDDYQVPDPYHGGRKGFENVYDIVDRTADMLLHRLVDEYDLEDEMRSVDA
ncbi:MAG: low molecular weight protein-tyrosine-phosphatase [Salinibacter sp.]